MATESYGIAAFVVGNGVHSDTFHAECASASFAAKFLGITTTYDAGDSPTNVDVELNAALDGAEKTELDGLVAAHDGTPPVKVLPRMTLQVINGEKTVDDIDPSWTVMGGIIADLSVLVPDLTKSIGRFVGDYKTSGTGCKVRICEDNGQSKVELASANLPNTSDAWKHDAHLDTDPQSVPFRTGRNRYTLEMQRPDALTTASLRDANLTLIEIL